MKKQQQLFWRTIKMIFVFFWFLSFLLSRPQSTVILCNINEDYTRHWVAELMGDNA